MAAHNGFLWDISLTQHIVYENIEKNRYFWHATCALRMYPNNKILIRCFGLKVFFFHNQLYKIWKFLNLTSLASNVLKQWTVEIIKKNFLLFLVTVGEVFVWFSDTKQARVCHIAWKNAVFEKLNHFWSKIKWPRDSFLWASYLVMVT